MRDISPCPETCDDDFSSNEPAIAASSKRVRSRGFIDREQLIAALGVDEEPQIEPANKNSVIRVSSKLLRVAETLLDRKAS